MISFIHIYPPSNHGTFQLSLFCLLCFACLFVQTNVLTGSMTNLLDIRIGLFKRCQVGGRVCSDYWSRTGAVIDLYDELKMSVTGISN